MRGVAVGIETELMFILRLASETDRRVDRSMAQRDRRLQLLHEKMVQGLGKHCTNTTTHEWR